VTEIERLKLLVTDSQTVAEVFKRQNQELMDRLDTERARAERAEAVLAEHDVAYKANVARAERAEKLAYIDEHRFLDATWKARCEEVVADLRKAESACAAYRAFVDLAERNLRAAKAQLMGRRQTHDEQQETFALVLPVLALVSPVHVDALGLCSEEVGRGWCPPSTVRLAVEALKEAIETHAEGNCSGIETCGMAQRFAEALAALEAYL
jgi:hypothetical protein